MPRVVRLYSALFGLAALALFVWAGAVGRAAAADTQILEIASKSGVHVFAVELAATDAERSRGLMFRKALPAGHGMLFDFKQDQMIAMWMRNTYISLDMIFIRSDGTVARIAQNTEPLSERIISSGSPVRAVLEVIGGTSRRLGLAPGDRVAHAMFRR
jgi:hypothetical protein